MSHLTLHQLSGYLDGELTEASTELVRLHLSRCSACTERFARMEAQEEILVRLLNHDPGEAFFEFFASAITLDGREAPPKWPPPTSAAEPESPLDLGGLVGPELDRETEIPLGDLETSMEGDPEALIPNVDMPAPATPLPPPRQVEAAPLAPRAPAAPARSPVLHGRREDDPSPARRRGGAAGWIVAAVMTVVALSMAFVASRPRVSPLPIPTTPGAPSNPTPGAPPAASDGSAAEAPAVGANGAEGLYRAGADAADLDSTSRGAAAEGSGEASDSSLDLLELPVWARAKAIQPPPAPRPGTKAAGAATEGDSQGAPTAAEPISTAQAFEGARQQSLRAADAMTAPAFEAAAAAWQAVLPRLEDEPEREAVAYREAAQSRFQAWAAGPTPARRDAAIHAVRAYLLSAPPGPDRDQAWTWLGRLKRSAGAATR